MTVIVVFYAVSAVAGMAPAWILGIIVDSVAELDTSGLRVLVLAALGFLVAQSVFTWLSVFVARRVSERILRSIRDDFVNDACRLPLRIIDHASTGDLMSRATADTAQVGRLLNGSFPEIVVSLVTVLVVTIGLLVISPVLAICVLTAVPTTVVGGAWALRRIRKVNLALREKLAVIAENTAADVQGADLIEMYGLHRQRWEVLQCSLRSSWGTAKTELKLRNVMFPSIDFGMTSIVVAGVVVGAWLHGAGWATLGDVTTGVFLMRQLSEPVAIILIWGQALFAGSASMSRVIGLRRAVTGRPAPAPGLSPRDGSVHTSELAFRYIRGGVTVVRDVTIDIESAERVAIVGASGAGKTTLARLIAGIDNPTEGSVVVGGEEISRLPDDERRRRVMMVTQDHHVFAGTIRDNLLLACPRATEDQLGDALSSVGALRWVESLPEALDTIVDGSDAKVGPAEAQRLALARVLLADPDILIMDEAMSQFSSAAVRDLDERLGHALKRTTVITIAHNLDTVGGSDRILVMDRGRVVEQGTATELITANGHFAWLWKTWDTARSRAAAGGGAGRTCANS